MTFNSYQYILLFLPMVVAIFHFLRIKNQTALALSWLLVSSLLFYVFADGVNIILLLVSITFNYSIGGLIRLSKIHSSRRMSLLILGIFINIVLLVYFKVGKDLPLGTSFFTLVQLIYLVDTFQNITPPNSYQTFATTIAFFPSISMGPINRPRELIHQLSNIEHMEFNSSYLAKGMMLFSIGLFKKVVIADTYAQIANTGFSSQASLSMADAWFSSFSFMLQLYYDFSGYSDMAVASAMLLGITIPINFNSPFKSKSIIEFWQRWHISFSSFVASYLYTPILRSFKTITFKSMMFATIIVMSITGIWHGLGLTYLVFGLMHGLALVINHFRKKRKQKLSSLTGHILTLLYLNLTFIVFKSSSMNQAFDIIKSLVNIKNVGHDYNLYITTGPSSYLILLIGIMITFLAKNSNELVAKFVPNVKNLIFISSLIIISLLYLTAETQGGFVYRGY